MKKILILLFSFFLILALNQSFVSVQENDEALAEQLTHKKEFDKAIVLWAKLYKSNQRKYFQRYFNCLVLAEEYKKAQKVLNNELRKTPNDHRLKIEQGLLFQKSGEVDKSIKYFDQLINNPPNGDIALRNWLYSFFKTRNANIIIQAIHAARGKAMQPILFYQEAMQIYETTKNKVALVDECFNLFVYNPSLISLVKTKLHTVLEEPEDFMPLKKLLIRRIQKNSNDRALMNFFIWTLIQLQEYETAFVQAKALDIRSKGNGMLMYDLGNALKEKQNHDFALKCFTYVEQKGRSSPYYFASKLAVISIKKEQVKSSISSDESKRSLEQDYEELLNEFGVNHKTLNAVMELAEIKAFYLNDTAGGLRLLNDVLESPRLGREQRAEIKLLKGDIQLLSDESWEALLTYGQIEKMMKNEELGYEAKLRKARVAFFEGEFTWASTQFEILKASTTENIANDALNYQILIDESLEIDTLSVPLKKFAKSSFLFFRKKYDETLLLIDEIKTTYPEHPVVDDGLMLKAKIYDAVNDFEKALNALNLILEMFSSEVLADDALFLKAKILDEKTNDPDGALAAYQHLIIRYPNSLFVSESRLRIRILRGEQL